MASHQTTPISYISFASIRACPPSIFSSVLPLSSIPLQLRLTTSTTFSLSALLHRRDQRHLCCIACKCTVEYAIVNVCVHMSPSDRPPPPPPSANFTSSAAYREGTHTVWCPGESWQDVLYLIYHLPFMLPGPSSIVTINTASCASIINAARRPNLPWPPNIADSSSPINFKTPTAAYCWCEPTHVHRRIRRECAHTDTHCCPWQVHWWRRRQAERQKSAWDQK